MKTLTIILSIAILTITAAGVLADEPCQDNTANKAMSHDDMTVLNAGENAPGFTLTGIPGKERSLSDFSGRLVVLEWVDFSCPEAEAQYRAGVIQDMQEKYRNEDVTWLSINSSSPDEPGYLENGKLRMTLAEIGSRATDYLTDADHEVADAYGVCTCPTIFVISPEGRVLYSGSLTDAKSTDPYKLRNSTNYLQLALDAALAGKEVQFASSQFFGCSVNR